MSNALARVLRDAATTLGIPTLETRGSDQLDFHEVSVWQLRAAIESAFEAGRQAKQQLPCDSKRYYCTVCHHIEVAALDGEDTCPDCLSRI